MKQFYTSDLHFGHKNILAWENRPWNSVEEMDTGLIERWNNKVRDEDHVWILGDLTFYKDARKNIGLVSQLKGHKHLIRGNHDYFVNSGYLNKFFETIDQYKRIQDNGREVILCHYPIHCWDKMKYGSYHLYGHVHGDPDWQLNQPNSFNVGVDVNNWEPKTLDELLGD